MDKVVEFVSRIPEQLSLNFYDFSKNCYEFSKFTGLETRVHASFLCSSP